MKPTTDIEQVKSVARALLMTEVYKTPYSPMVVQHPFTSSGFVATTKDGVMQLIDIWTKINVYCKTDRGLYGAKTVK